MQRLWIISRICEEFHCLPIVAERLWLDDTEDTALMILEFRAYARSKAARAYSELTRELLARITRPKR